MGDAADRRPSSPSTVMTPRDAPQAGRPTRPRRAQADRRAETRAKLVEAAISCLHRRGYAATTLSLVVEEAKVSRGAMTYHFPAKDDLMVAVIEEVFRREAEIYNRDAGPEDPISRLRDLPRLVCEVLAQPAAVAQMEVMLAARSEPALAARLRAIESEIATRAAVWVDARFAEAGVRRHRESEALRRLLIAAGRGLALESVTEPHPEEHAKAVDLLMEAYAHFHPELRP